MPSRRSSSIAQQFRSVVEVENPRMTQAGGEDQIWPNFRRLPSTGIRAKGIRRPVQSNLNTDWTAMGLPVAARPAYLRMLCHATRFDSLAISGDIGSPS